ncbi:MAG TPA: MFS transporter [Kineosporiaceae bacterium]|nr:MFS transporter [Kineosporiaceae bacterium]
MYLSSARARDAALDRSRSHQDGRPKGRARVSANVVALGSVSLVTDISSEMITAVLPVYLVFGLGVSLLSVGFVDGLYAGVTVLVSLLAAHVADRTQRRKAVAAIGYGMSAVSKLGLLAVGASVGGIAAVIGVDRTGKGLRTAPRDALISLSSPADSLGRSFGVHRAMDTAGALLGPLVAFLVLRSAPQAYDAVFVVSFCIAAAGVVVLLTFVRNRRNPLASRAEVSLRAGLALLGRPMFRRVTIQATVLAAVTLSDAFVYLLLQHQLDVALVYFPLLPLGTSAVYMVLAAPVGRLADRWGRWRVFIAGNVAMLAVYAVLLAPIPAAALLVLALTLHGVYYAATSGVLMALVAPALPAPLRTSGMAIVQSGTAAAAFVSSVVAGALWSWRGPTFTVCVFLVGLAVALAGVVATAVRGSLAARASA